MIKHEYPEGEHIQRDKQPIADALFFRRQVITFSRRKRCCMCESVFRVTWEIPVCPVRVTLTISKTKCHRKQAGKSEQRIVAVKLSKDNGAKDLQFGLFLLQGRGHNSSKEVVYAEY